MDVAGPGAHHTRHDVGKRARARDRRLFPRGDDGARDAARVALLAEDIDDVGELGLGSLRDHVGCGRAVTGHPHVERTVEAKREAAPGLVELHRGDADIHHHAVDGFDTLRGADLGEVGEAVLHQGQPAGRLIDQ